MTPATSAFTEQESTVVTRLHHYLERLGLIAIAISVVKAALMLLSWILLWVAFSSSPAGLRPASPFTLSQLREIVFGVGLIALGVVCGRALRAAGRSFLQLAKTAGHDKVQLDEALGTLTRAVLAELIVVTALGLSTLWDLARYATALATRSS